MEELLRNAQQLEVIRISQAILHQARESGYSRQLIEPIKEMLSRSITPAERAFLEKVFREVIQHRYTINLEASPYDVGGAERIKRIIMDIADYSQKVLDRIEREGSVSPLNRAYAAWLKAEAAKVEEIFRREGSSGPQMAVRQAHSIADIAEVFRRLSGDVLSTTARVEGDISQTAAARRVISQVEEERKSVGKPTLTHTERAKIYEMMHQVLSGTSNPRALIGVVLGLLPAQNQDDGQENQIRKVLQNIYNSLSSTPPSQSSSPQDFSGPQHSQQAVEIIQGALNNVPNMPLSQQRQAADLATGLLNPAMSSFATLEAAAAGFALMDSQTQQRLQQGGRQLREAFMHNPAWFIGSMLERLGRLKSAIIRAVSIIRGDEDVLQEARSNPIGAFILNIGVVGLSRRQVERVDGLRIDEFYRYGEGFLGSNASSGASNPGQQSGSSNGRPWKPVHTLLLQLRGYNVGTFELKRAEEIMKEFQKKYGLNLSTRLRGGPAAMIERWFSLLEDKQRLADLKSRLFIAMFMLRSDDGTIQKLQALQAAIEELEAVIKKKADNNTGLLRLSLWWYIKGINLFSIRNLMSGPFPGLNLLAALNELSEGSLKSIGCNEPNKIKQDFNTALALASLLRFLSEGGDVRGVLLKSPNS